MNTERRRSRDYQLIFYVSACVLTTLMIGLRYQVGGDWGAYQRIYTDIYFLPLREALRTTDVGYSAINWIVAQFDGGIVFVNLICATIFMVGFARLSWLQPNPSLAILIAVPYLIIVVSMGYTRQAAAIGIICFAVADMSENRLFRIIFYIVLAALFHRTAILILPLILVPIFRRSALYSILGFIFFLIVSFLVLRDSSDKLITNYVQGNYDSQGAGIRIAMNVLASFGFLYIKKNVDIPIFQKTFWSICSILSILSVVALLLSSASAGIDRISLYLIPLQIVTFSRLPISISNYNKSNPAFVIIIILYCFFVQFTWLNYANNSWYWIPYDIEM